MPGLKIGKQERDSENLNKSTRFQLMTFKLFFMESFSLNFHPNPILGLPSKTSH